MSIDERTLQVEVTVVPPKGRRSGPCFCTPPGPNPVGTAPGHGLPKRYSRERLGRYFAIL